MKQYWTPLAKIFGLSSTPSEQNQTAFNDIEQPVSIVNQEHLNSPWPDLFQALREHALEHWVTRSRRHANINPDERLAITSLKIRGTTAELQNQLQDWFSESDAPHLIQWMVRGPFRNINIESWVILDTLNQIQVLPMEKVDSIVTSAYAVTSPTIKASLASFDIEAETQWQPKNTKSTPIEDLPPLELIIHDAMGERRSHVRQTLIVLGAEKTLKTSDGEMISLKDQSPFEWQGETAWFIGVKAQHVSGIHLVLRLQASGVDCLDEGSTNGTYVNGQRLNAGNRHEVPHVETLFLGGPESDPRTHSAKIELRVGHPVFALGKDRTPLRVGTPQADSPILITLQAINIPNAQPVHIHALPFNIGREISSDWVISPEHEMVSRKHLVIQEVDTVRRQIKLRDVSKHGLTQSRIGWQGSVEKGVWVSWEDEVTLGKTSHQSGVTFRIVKSV